MSLSEFVDQKPLSLYDRMMDDIAKGVLAGGERLKVAKLAERYGVSTSPVREVLRQLQGEGFVEFSPNRGATVKRADSVTITEIFELLQLLEPYFVSWFVQNVQQSDLVQLNNILHRLEQIPVQQRADYASVDAEFHGYMYNRHYNRRAVQIWNRQRRALNIFSLSLPIGSGRERAIKSEHRELLDALSHHDAEAAAEVISRHIAGSGEHMARQLRMLGLDDG